MQANTTTSQSRPTQYESVKIADNGSSWSAQPIPAADGVLPFDQNNSVHDFAVPIIPGKFSVRILQASRPYVALSVNRKILYRAFKRGIDVVVSSALLLVTLPLSICVAILIKLTSPGPVFFKHQRLGRDGKLFWCFKFRTMRADAEERLRQDPKLVKEFEQCFKIKGDPRITPLGALLRKTSLDELPQLIQVLRGEMSLIGPRPIVEPERSKYTIYAEKLLSVRPGLSGLWQVCGRSEVAYPERVIMDMYYIEHRCLLLEMQLMLLTPFAVLNGHGAR